jgi:phosphoglycerate dehydrogenase-like enzyme
MARRKTGKAKIGVVISQQLCRRLFAPQDRRRLEKLGKVRWVDVEEHVSEEAAIEVLRDCQVGVGSWGTPCPKSATLMAACPKLRLWEHAAGTVRSMFEPHLEGRDLVIASCKTAIADTVAEFTLGEIILGLHRVFQNVAANRAAKSPPPEGLKSLYGSTIGVISASEVGRRVVRLLQPFRARVLLFDPFITDRGAARLGAKRVRSLLELCRASDCVTLHAPALPTTARMLGAREFRAMRDDAVFINTARGMCIDEAALGAELAKGRLSAFIDVSVPEPAADDSPLRRLPNAFYTSHIAGMPFFNIGAQAVDDIAAFLKGKKPMCIQTADMVDRIG